MNKLLLSMALLLHPVACFAQNQLTVVSSSITFTIKNAGFSVSGSLDELKAKLVFSPDQLERSSLSGSVSAGTISTGNSLRDKHLKAEKFFDCRAYPVLSMRSVRLYKKGSGYAGEFDVSIRNISKRMEIPFDYIPLTGGQSEIRSSFEINRRDFGVGEASLIMSDKVMVVIDLKARIEQDAGKLLPK